MPEHSEEEETTPTTAIDVQPEIPKEPSPLNVVLGVLSELAPQKEVGESELGGRDEPDKPPSFTSEGNKGKDLPPAG